MTLKVSGLTHDQVLAEATYLKYTIAANIRLTRKEGSHFVKHGREELIRQIHEAVYLTYQVDNSLEKLLQKNIFNDQQPDVRKPTFTVVGTVGCRMGPLMRRELELFWIPKVSNWTLL